MGVVPLQPYLPSGHAPTGRTERPGGHLEPHTGADPRVGARRHRLPLSDQQMGLPHPGPLRVQNQREDTSFLLQGREGPILPCGRPGNQVVGRASLRLPPPAPSTQGGGEAQKRQIQRHIDRPVVAPTGLVRPTTSHGSGHVQPPSNPPPPLSELREHPPPGPAIHGPDGLEGLPELLEVLQAARRPSTRKLYSYKWKKFLAFARDKGLPASDPPLALVCDFLLSLKRKGLSISTLRVYLSAIVANQPPESSGSRLFRLTSMKKFLRGLGNLYPDSRLPPPQWSLSVVLQSLMKPPFEPLATVSQRLLSLKVAFLVAITSARRVSELAALRHDPPFLQFFKDKVVAYPDVSFIPKVSSRFHLSQPIVLPVFYPSPASPLEVSLHSLDVRRALAYYTSRTASCRQTTKLFVSYKEGAMGRPVSSQRLAHWLVDTITLAYQVAKLPSPSWVRAHSTRALSSSTAFLRGVALEDICASATWSHPSTFVTHYRLDTRQRSAATVGRAVLSSVFT